MEIQLINHLVSEIKYLGKNIEELSELGEKIKFSTHVHTSKELGSSQDGSNLIVETKTTITSTDENTQQTLETLELSIEFFFENRSGIQIKDEKARQQFWDVLDTTFDPVITTIITSIANGILYYGFSSKKRQSKVTIEVNYTEDSTTISIPIKS